MNNPSVGTTYHVGDREAYVCSTGYPFLRQGTANPLHVIMVDGTLSLLGGSGGPLFPDLR